VKRTGQGGAPQSTFAVMVVWNMSRLRDLGIGLLCLPAIAATAVPAWGEGSSGDGLSWTQLSVQQQMILAPLEREWAKLPDDQRQRLVGAASGYPEMDRSQQERFSSRLLQWSRLSLAQRNLARTKFKEWQALPPREREKVERRWHQWLASKGEDEKGITMETSTPSVEGQRLHEIEHGLH
jgi:hypothetical protein